ncbi:hypothetical protein BBJ28_00025676, partial [Nothophytophthora sp. Chile5]
LAFVKENQLEGQEEEHEVTFGETEAGTDPDPEHPESLVTFCDGSVLGFGQPFCNGGAAYACIFPHRREWDEVASVAGSEVTNTHVEYLAAVAAMERANYEDPSGEDVLFIFSDSLVLIDCMTSWVSKWQTNGWRTAKGRAVKNRETIERLVNAQGGRRVLWRHVKAHTAAEDWASHWNSVADTEAPVFGLFISRFGLDGRSTPETKATMAQRSTYYAVEVVERTGFFTPSDDTEINARQNKFASEHEAITYLMNHGINVSGEDEDATDLLAQGIAGVDITAVGDDLVAVCASSTNGNGTENCRGVCAVHFPNEDNTPRFSRVTRQGTRLTNIRVDYYAVLRAIEYANELDPNRNRKLVVYTSNEPLVNSMSGDRAVDMWQRNNWKKKGKLVKNHDLLEALLRGEQSRGRAGIEWRHTEGTWVLGIYTTAQEEAKMLVDQAQQ